MNRVRWGVSLFVCTFLAVGSAHADPVTVILDAQGDTYVRGGSSNTNEGASSFTQVQSSGNNRALVRFSQVELESALGDGSLISATLELTITENGDNWGSTGRTVDAHRVTVDWAEGNGQVSGHNPSDRGAGSGATWNCAIDSNISNSAKDCIGSTEWNMSGSGARPWVTVPTASLLITNSLTGAVTWNVTSDVDAFLTGTGNYGWVIKRTDEGASGQADFGSRESANPPRLILVVDMPTPNFPPAISGNPPARVNEGDSYSFIPTASDQNPGDVLTFSIQNKPAWASFNASTGELSGTPSLADVGIYDNIIITVTDPAMASDSLPPFSIAVTITLEVVADTYLRSGAENTNEGGSTFLRVRESGDNRALVRFSQAELEAAVGAGALSWALLEADIQHNGDNWGTGRAVDAHLLTSDWTEGNGKVSGINPSDRGTGPGATWNCATDADIENQAKDCSGVSEWNMSGAGLRPWAEVPTDTVTITNLQSGTVAWDVTADALSFLSGSAPNYGWLIRKTEEGQPGLVEFDSRESGNPPRLVLAIDTSGVSNHPPTISGTPPTSVNEDSLYSFTPTASDPDAGDTLTFQITNKPAWAAFSTSSGTLSGTPTNADVGTYTGIVISVRDSALATATLPPFSITVVNTNDAPTISGNPPTTVSEDSFYTFTPSASDDDIVHGDSLTFSIQNQPAWTSFNLLTGELSGTPANEYVGVYPGVVICVSDGEAPDACLPAFSVTVTNTNDPPSISGTPDTAVFEDSFYGFVPTALDDDLIYGDTLEFSVQNLPPWAEFDPFTGTLSGAPENGDVGTYAGIIITVTDDSFASAALPAFSITVVNTNDVPTISGTPPTTVSEDSFYTFVPSASDDDLGDALSFTIQNKPAWASFSAVTGELSGTPINADVGTYVGIVISVQDLGGATASLPAFSITVTNTNDPPTIAGTPPTQVAQGALYNFTPSATDEDFPHGDVLTFSITNRPPWASFDTETGRLFGTPGNADIGTYSSIVITATDSSNASAQLAAFTIEVTNVNDPPSIGGTPSTSVNAGELYSFTPTASDPDTPYGDTLTFSVQNPPPWASFSTATGALSGTPTVADAGTYSGIVVSVQDSSLATAALAPFSIEVVYVVTNCVPDYEIVRVSVDSEGNEGNDWSLGGYLSADGRYTAFDSISDNLVSNDTNWTYDVFVFDRQTCATERVSVSSAGDEADASSSTAAISPDGRYVLFYSDATNLVPDDTNGFGDVFMRDRLSGETERVSLRADGGEVQGESSYSRSLSADGTWVVFESFASDVVPGDTNNNWDVFVRNRLTGQVERASVTSSGGQVFGASFGGYLSADGTLLVFDSEAFNLVSGDTNGVSDVFIRDLQTGTTTRVLGESGVQGNGYSCCGVLSPDGRYLVFESEATNLVADDTNDASDVFLRDLVTGEFERISLSSVGEEGDGFSAFEAISADGRYVLFFSDATNLVPGDTNAFGDVFVRDRASGQTRRANLNALGVEASDFSGPGSISEDGRFVAFNSGATNLVPNDTNGAFDVFVAPNPFLISAPPLPPLISSVQIVCTPGSEQTTILGEGFLQQNGTANGVLITTHSIAPLSAPVTRLLTDLNADAQNTQVVIPGIVSGLTDVGIVDVSLATAEGTSNVVRATSCLGQGNTPPSIGGVPPASVNQGELYSFIPSAFDPDPTDVLEFIIENQPLWAFFDPFSGELSGVPGNDDVGVHEDIVISVTDGRSLPVSLPPFSIEVFNVNDPPTITASAPASANAFKFYQFVPAADDPDLLYGDEIFFSISGKPRWARFDANTGVLSGAPADTDIGVFAGISISVRDIAGETATFGPFSIEVVPGSLPPDPALVATPLDQTVAANIFDGTEFLYSGSDPIQMGIEAEVIVPRQAAVIRGQVLGTDGTPLPGVRVSIADHPGYGFTFSRADGWYDLAVNGGGLLTLDYERSGFISAQRQSDIPWQDYVVLDEVRLVAYDTASTVVNFSDPIQVHQASVVTDQDGTRQAVLLFEQGTQASAVLPDGSEQALSSLTVRATELTVGEHGPQSMPAELPPTSAYTYAVELSADEAVALGAKSVSFSKPVVQYLENFLNFPAGAIVPVGYYDPTKKAWVPSANGRVVQILSTAGGQATLDVIGEGNPASAAELDELGITSAELTTLASLYSPGQTLWRYAIPHFTSVDANCPYHDTERKPKPPKPKSKPKDDDEDDPCKASGSIIGCLRQTLGEAVRVTGTPFSLHYQSERVGRTGASLAREITFTITDDDVPADLGRILAELSIAGRTLRQELVSPFVANQEVVFVWDGLDAYGRPFNGSVPYDVKITHFYPGLYRTFLSRILQMLTEAGCRIIDVFGLPADLRIVAVDSAGQPCQVFSLNLAADVASREAQGVSTEFSGVFKNNFDVTTASIGLGGWTLSEHHQYDPAGRVLYTGDGERRVADNVAWVIETVAGIGPSPHGGFSGDGGPALEARLQAPYGMAVASDGSIYFAAAGNHRVRKISPSGVITTVAGNGTAASTGDGGPALAASLNSPLDVALAPDGSLYIAENEGNRIRRVASDGLIETVAGTGIAGYSGDGGPATQAKLSKPSAVELAPDGTLFIADWLNRRVRRVGPDGVITTIAGNGNNGGLIVEGLMATNVGIGTPIALAWRSDGDLLIANSRTTVGGPPGFLYRVDPSGRIHPVAGNGSYGAGGDGGSAALAALDRPRGVAIDSEGVVYIADFEQNRLRRIGTNEIINTIAGNGLPPSLDEQDGVAVGPRLNDPSAVALSPDGSIYVSDWGNSRIKRVKQAIPGFSGDEILIASEDGSELYRFSSTGRHLGTRDTLTGTILYSFTYNSQGQLVAMRDRNGLETVIERDPSGNPTAIVAPGGQRTALSLGSDGYLARIENPAGEADLFTYTAVGLLSTRTDPKGSVYRFYYDPNRRLIRDEDPSGGFTELSQVEADECQLDSVSLKDCVTVTKSTAEGRITTYLRGIDAFDNRVIQVTHPSGLIQKRVGGIDGSSTWTDADGTIAIFSPTAHPQYGMQVPITSATIALPSGILFAENASIQTSLSEPGNPMSLTTRTETRTINNKTYSAVYRADAFGGDLPRTLTVTSPEGRTIKQSLDSLGNIVFKQQTNLIPIIAIYDPTRGLLNQITQGSGLETRATTYTYDIRDRLETIVDSEMRQMSFEYDNADRVTKKTLPDGHFILYGYDANGNLTSVTPPGRPAHIFNYTPVNLMNQYSPPDLSNIPIEATVYTYNRDRQLELITRPDGLEIDYSYNSRGQVASVLTPDGALGYVYDPVSGKLATLTAPGGVTLDYTYDGNLLASTTWSGSQVVGNVSRTYNNDLLVSFLSVNADSIPLTYDDDSLLIGAGTLSIARDPVTGLITSTALGGVTDSRDYNSFGELQGYDASYNFSTLYSSNLTRDTLGRITQKVETILGATTTYDYFYDSIGHLEEVHTNGMTTAEYQYDDNGNRLVKTGPTESEVGGYDDQDRLLSYGETGSEATYVYADNGELLSKTDINGTTTYYYDGLGNLREVMLPNGDLIEYIVDGENRRIGKLRNGVFEKGLLYQDKVRPVAELDGNGVVMSMFVYGSERYSPDYIIKDGNEFRIVKDYLGSVRLVVEASTGIVVQRMDYDEFGKVVNDTNPGFQPFGFAGGIYDEDTGLARFGARDYDAKVGRWTSKDPILFKGGDTNLYGYVVSDPINFIDPLGMAGVECHVQGCVGGVCAGIEVGSDCPGDVDLTLELGLGAGASAGCSASVGTDEGEPEGLADVSFYAEASAEGAGLEAGAEVSVDTEGNVSADASAGWEVGGGAQASAGVRIEF
ncbi:MAG: putative Ig domain-containing protein [Bdellovibrionota bacterium]